MKKLLLTKGKYAKVNNSDFEWLNQWKWCISGNGYAKRMGKDRKIIYLHRLIMNFPNKMDIDHINHDKLDNRRINLRICTRRDNILNTGVRKTNTSGFKGVYWSKDKKKWQAQICVNYKNINLSGFVTPKEASQAYLAATIYFRG